jgi:hypothetical protein
MVQGKVPLTSDAHACPLLLTSSAIGIIAGFGSIKWTTFFAR